MIWNTLQEINISHLGKRKIIFKYAIFGGYVSSLEINHPVSKKPMDWTYFFVTVKLQENPPRMLLVIK